MDGISIASTAFEIAHLAHNIYDYIQSVRKAEKWFKPIAEHVRVTAGVLQDVARVLGDEDVRKECRQALIESTDEALRGCRKAFEELDTLLKSMCYNNKDGKPVLTAKAKLTMHFKQDELNAQQAHLERFKSSLDLIVGLLNVAMSIKKRKDEVETYELKLEVARLIKLEQEAKERDAHMVKSPATPGPDDENCLPEYDPGDNIDRGIVDEVSRDRSLPAAPGAMVGRTNYVVLKTTLPHHLGPPTDPLGTVLESASPSQAPIQTRGISNDNSQDAPATSGPSEPDSTPTALNRRRRLFPNPGRGPDVPPELPRGINPSMQSDEPVSLRASVAPQADSASHSREGGKIESTPEDTLLSHLKSCAEAVAKLASAIEEATQEWQQKQLYKSQCLAGSFQSTRKAVQTLHNHELDLDFDHSGQHRSPHHRPAPLTFDLDQITSPAFSLVSVQGHSPSPLAVEPLHTPIEQLPTFEADSSQSSLNKSTGGGILSMMSGFPCVGERLQKQSAKDQCPLCSKTYTRASHLRRHLSTHTERRLSYRDCADISLGLMQSHSAERSGDESRETPRRTWGTSANSGRRPRPSNRPEAQGMSPIPRVSDGYLNDPDSADVDRTRPIEAQRRESIKDSSPRTSPGPAKAYIMPSCYLHETGYHHPQALSYGPRSSPQVQRTNDREEVAPRDAHPRERSRDQDRLVSRRLLSVSKSADRPEGRDRSDKSVKRHGFEMRTPAGRESDPEDMSHGVHDFDNARRDMGYSSRSRSQSRSRSRSRHEERYQERERRPYSRRSRYGLPDPILSNISIPPWSRSRSRSRSPRLPPGHQHAAALGCAVVGALAGNVNKRPAPDRYLSDDEYSISMDERKIGDDRSTTRSDDELAAEIARELDEYEYESEGPQNREPAAALPGSSSAARSPSPPLRSPQPWEPNKAVRMGLITATGQPIISPVPHPRGSRPGETFHRIRNECQPNANSAFSRFPLFGCSVTYSKLDPINVPHTVFDPVVYVYAYEEVVKRGTASDDECNPSIAGGRTTTRRKTEYMPKRAHDSPETGEERRAREESYPLWTLYSKHSIKGRWQPPPFKGTRAGDSRTADSGPLPSTTRSQLPRPLASERLSLLSKRLFLLSTPPEKYIDIEPTSWKAAIIPESHDPVPHKRGTRFDIQPKSDSVDIADVDALLRKYTNVEPA